MSPASIGNPPPFLSFALHLPHDTFATMNTDYRHRDFSLEMARTLRLVSHSDSHDRFFHVSGAEPYTSLDDRLSAIDSPVLIAIDKGESSSSFNSADCLRESRSFCIIIALPTDNDDSATIEQAVTAADTNLLQIRNVLIARYGRLLEEMRTYPSGVIGDNFYGSVLEYSFAAYPDYGIDPSFFHAEERT